MKDDSLDSLLARIEPLKPNDGVWVRRLSSPFECYEALRDIIAGDLTKRVQLTVHTMTLDDSDEHSECAYLDVIHGDAGTARKDEVPLVRCIFDRYNEHGLWQCISAEYLSGEDVLSV